MPSRIIKEIPFMPSTIENIDMAFYNYINETLNLSTTTNDGYKKVPVLWVSAERAFITKTNKDQFDTEGSIIYPVITIERSKTDKSLSYKGSAIANIPRVGDEKGGSVTIARRIQHQKTSEFANKQAYHKWYKNNYKFNNKKVVYEVITIPMPVYLDIEYSVKIKTNYQQQMNELLTPFLSKPDGINYILISNEGHRYEGFIQEGISSENSFNEMSDSERLFQTTVIIRVLGYIMGEANESQQPKIVIRETAAEFRFSRERVMVGDIPETGYVRKYRE